MNCSVGLACLGMHGIPRALGCRAYLSVGQEVGALYTLFQNGGQ